MRDKVRIRAHLLCVVQKKREACRKRKEKAKKVIAEKKAAGIDISAEEYAAVEPTGFTTDGSWSKPLVLTEPNDGEVVDLSTIEDPFGSDRQGLREPPRRANLIT